MRLETSPFFRQLAELLHFLKAARMASTDNPAFQALELRIKTILPEQYQDSYDEVQPVSMGSASLKYGTDGKVAWDQMWDTFCDLAMAGGPPHKGSLLEPGSAAEISAQRDRYQVVIGEICRGIRMVAELDADEATTPGWIGVGCESPTMAEWLVRAIVMENVSARCEGSTLYLPAAPGFQIGKEIKNVVTVIAKTCHYWLDHMWTSQEQKIASLFAQMAVESPLIQPVVGDFDVQEQGHQRHISGLADSIFRATGLRRSHHQYAGWLGLECPTVRSAIWMVRALVASNVLSRREGTVMFVPVNQGSDPTGGAVARLVATVHRFAVERSIL